MKVQCELDAHNILFSELEGRIIYIGEQIKIELFKSGNFVVTAVVKMNGTRIDVNIFANKYINFPKTNGIFSISEIIFDEKLEELNNDIESVNGINFKTNTTEYTNSNIAIRTSLSAELIFSNFISGYKIVEITRLFFGSSYIKQPIYSSELIGGILKITKENVVSFNIALEKILLEVIDFDKYKIESNG